MRSKPLKMKRWGDNLGDTNDDMEWEMRPGGMMVQKRCSSVEVAAPANVSVRIAYGALRYEIFINPQGTFGELKKLLSTETGLQPVEQKLIFRGKERKNGSYLDVCGVKDRSKIILTEDPTSKEKRFIEMRRNAKVQSVHRAISDISMELDKLGEQVSAVEKSVSNGKNVAQVQVTVLIEMLMRQAIKLESISADGEASSAQKSLQGGRVQKCVEKLDVLKKLNGKVKPVVVTTTSWEFFD